MERVKRIIRTKEDAKRIANGLMRLNLSTAYELTLADHQDKKTDSQRKYVHSLIGYLAQGKKIPNDQAKIDAKREWGVITVSTSCITGERQARLLSIADYTKDQIAALISSLEAYLDQENIFYIRSANQ